MKTITESITLMVMCIVVALFCLETMIGNIILHQWWLVAINAICVIANVIFARISYKQAKRIEESREAWNRMIYDILPIDEIIVYRVMSKVFKDIKPKDKEDEVASDK